MRDDKNEATSGELELIDSHCHFDFEAFAADRQQVWQQSQALGMQHLLVPGICPEQWPHARALCSQNPGMVYAAGLHPWWLNKVDVHAEHLVELIEAELQQSDCRAIGECGLDALMDMPVEQQMPLLDAQLALAAKLKVPIILHCVRAHNPMLRALKKHQPSAGGVIHAYAGSYEQAMQYWQMGFYRHRGYHHLPARKKKPRRSKSLAA